MAGVRFAPSPTGAFHLGNFRTAWISWAWARELGLPWVVRFEDIDSPRVVPGAMDRQLEEMRRLGMTPDEVLVQSRFHGRHWETFLKAVSEGVVYPCFCSRREVREALEGAASAPQERMTQVAEGVVPSGAPRGEASAVYNGRCRRLERPVKGHGLLTLAWRFRAPEERGSQDIIVARTGTELDSRGAPRPEGFVPAYHWACALDDFDGRYELLVRASDLANAAEHQRRIQAWLGGPSVPFSAVYHCALVVSDDGSRLEKRTKGITFPELEAAGWTPERVLERFKASAEIRRADFQPGKLLFESRYRVTLKELGFQFGTAGKVS